MNNAMATANTPPISIVPEVLVPEAALGVADVVVLSPVLTAVPVVPPVVVPPGRFWVWVFARATNALNEREALAFVLFYISILSSHGLQAMGRTSR